jgi:glycosyltransferase involved in cell wall biosynthesis
MRASYETLLKQPAQTSFLLPNDISSAPPRRVNYADYPIRILMAGRLTALKNFAGALREISIFNQQVSASVAKIQVTIFGEGPEQATLSHLIRSLEMENVLIKPWADSLVTQFSEHDLFIHPSRSEGMSNVVLEALAAGLPVLLSDIPAHRSLGEPKLLYSVTDLGHLAARLRRMFDDPEEYQYLIRASEKVGQSLRFDWDAEVRRLLVL